MSEELRPAPRRGFADLYLTLAAVLAAVPAALLIAGLIGVQIGLSDWKGGFGLFVLEWAPRLALASVAGGLIGLVVALMSGFSRYWRRALLVLAITTATLAAYVWSIRPAAPVAAQAFESLT
jgi:fatty-acyl-CoA synthase